jgi:DNA polymerase (family 10)
MQAIKGVEKVEVAGSLRRWKETVKDLDILVTGNTEYAKEVMDIFTSYMEVENTISRGETKATVKWKMGIQVDLRFIESNCFGAGMQYFTGSKEHNIALRTLAKEKGFKTSEYGIFKILKKKEKKVAGKSEEEFYQCLGMDYIAPELRENAGEIEAAMSGKLPCLLEQTDIRGDLQMHTTQSDGKNSLEEMVQASIALGYEFIAITDHSKAMHVANGLDEKRLSQWIETIHRTRNKYPQFHILAGIEVDILKDGSLDLEEKILRECDVVVASIHTSLRMESEDMTKRIMDGISHPFVHILAHPTARLIQQREPIEYDFDKVLEVAIKNKIALEVNSSPKRLDLKDVLIRKVIENKGFITINTDAHSCEQLLFMKYGVHTARRGWCEKKDCINTFDINKLNSFLSKKL